MRTPRPMSRKHTKRIFEKRQQQQQRCRGKDGSATEDVINLERFSFWSDRVIKVKFTLVKESSNFNRKSSVNRGHISEFFSCKMVAPRKKSFHGNDFMVSSVTALGTLLLESSLEEISLHAIGTWYLVLPPQFRLLLVHMHEHLIYTQNVTNATKHSNTYSILTYSILTCYCLKATVHNVIGVICSVLVTMYVICLGLVCKRPRCHGMQSDFLAGHDSREWYVIAGLSLQESSHRKHTSGFPPVFFFQEVTSEIVLKFFRNT